MKPRIAIFFDTNVLETRVGTVKGLELLPHAHIIPNSCFGNWLNFKEIYENRIQVDFFIASITKSEIREHYINNYNDISDKLHKIKKFHKDNMQNIMRMEFELIVEKYEEEFERVFDSFLDKNCIRYIDYFNADKIFKQIINNALKCLPPFRYESKNKGGDVGFKDALLFEIIKEHRDLNQYDLHCLVTNDKDFSKYTTNENDLSILDDVYIIGGNSDFVQLFKDKFSLYAPNELLKQRLDNDYNKENIIYCMGLNFDEEVDKIEILEVLTTEDENIFNVILKAEVSETLYDAEIQYDTNASAYLDHTLIYKLGNE